MIDTVETARGVSCRVWTGGAGEPLVYLHGFRGLVEEALLERLALHYRVYAPELPGYGPSAGSELLEDMLDFTLHSWDVVAALGVERPALVGHSMGGMIAAEMAAVCPQAVDRLALIAPLGLWIDDDPVPDLFAMTPHQLPAVLFADPASAAALLPDLSDGDALIEFLVGNAQRMGMAGKILFPIPDRRLSKRLYRLRAPTLLVWGSEDRLLGPAYTERWCASVPHADLVWVSDAGHMAVVEQPDAVADAIAKFLG